MTQNRTAITDLDTPALLVDLDIMAANIARAAAECRANAIAWRPHIKGQKTPEIVKQEIAAGAIGATCAKLGEAEIMAQAGITDLLIANQIVGPQKIARLIALLNRADVKVACDSAANATALGAAAHAAGKTLGVLIEVNTGMNRAGTEPGAPSLALARHIAATPGLKLRGVMGWEAHTVAMPDQAEKQTAIAAAIARLVATANAIREAGIDCDIVSCGGTGSFPYCARQPGVTEIQAGGLIFSDELYRTRFGLDFPQALTLLATVTSRPTPTRIILDAGKKAMSSDAAPPRPLGLQTSKPVALSAEHATVILDAPSATPAVGDKVQFVVGYSDTTVHLHERIHAHRGGHVEAAWPVQARGRIA
ncbi:MAG: alanine racemase [Acetobacteraceae bacterium]|nr:alanine racemase [Acetobacteraceae bacterium]